MNLTTIDALHIPHGARVLLRVDYNLPLARAQNIDPARITRSLPTIKKLAAQGAKIILLSHMGRPKGAVVPKYSLHQLCSYLATVFAAHGFHFCAELAQAPGLIAQMRPGSVLLLENLRFDAGEEQNDPAFAAELAKLGDYYINDAFSCAHRAHASTVGICKLLPSAAGLLMAEEVCELDRLLATPKLPLLAIIGGAKISSKIDLIESMLIKVESVAIGGAMANSFLHAKGYNIGKSLYEAEQIATAQAIIDMAAKLQIELLLPTDVVVAKELSAEAATRVCSVADVQADEMILDLGPQSTNQLCARIATVCTVIWNGPLGAFEYEPFAQATKSVAKYIAERTKKGYINSIAGGGDSLAAIKLAGVEPTDFTYLSTAGGAFLEWLEGKSLPGVICLAAGASI